MLNSQFSTLNSISFHIVHKNFIYLPSMQLHYMQLHYIPNLALMSLIAHVRLVPVQHLTQTFSHFLS